ncbi:hypothetical protein EIP91_006495 [Steccherinum ochraceum]|uniref:FAD-binding domain-containing protein n=1 Tax=Steccherinum ochraceum TaxID=92696 RepID=A0A4R0RZ56_9APHY|nr:hypothetical protein EIP91_006495 [Steccherinum ochraceum]
MSLPEIAEVLIVGAGPAGLACALSLHKKGCRNIIMVDATENNANGSRAMAIHAATLEVLSSIGVAQSLVDVGNPVQTMRGYDVGGNGFVTIADFSSLKSSRFPYLLVIPQTVTERVLGEHIKAAGIKVLRPFKAVGIQPDQHDKRYTTVLFEGGQTVKARYVIGADGARSAIRQAAGIDFKDPSAAPSALANSSLNQAALGDVTYTKPLPPLFDNPIFILSPNNLFLSAPLRVNEGDPSRMYRIVSGVPDSDTAPPSHPDKYYLQGLLDKSGLITAAGGAGIAIDEVSWSTRYKTRSCIADTFFTRLDGGQGGAILLIGDAAHIHSPAGGQGMNLGLRDAVSLGTTLAPLIASSSVDDTSLRAWADERRQLGLKIIKLTKSILGIASGQNGRGMVWIGGYVPVPIQWCTLRSWGLWVLNRSSWLQGLVAWRLSGLGNV